MPVSGGDFKVPVVANESSVPLSQLHRGTRARITCSALDALGERERCLLEAMGFSESCCVRVCRAGSPCIVQIDQTRFGLAREVSERIMVTPLVD